MLINPNRNFGNETLCWCCQRAACDLAHECKWAIAGLPVKGWHADKGTLWDGSMIVRMCPEFKADQCVEDVIKEAIYDEYVHYKNFNGERIINTIMNRMYHLDYDTMARESYEFLVNIYLPTSLHITSHIECTPCAQRIFNVD